MPRTFIQRTADQPTGLCLGQREPNGLTAASIYSPADGIQAVIRKIIVCRTSGAPAYRIFHDETGTTYDTSTALYYDVTLTAGTDLLDVEIYMTNPDGNLAVRTDTTAALTFTVYGQENQVRAR